MYSIKMGPFEREVITYLCLYFSGYSIKRKFIIKCFPVYAVSWICNITWKCRKLMTRKSQVSKTKNTKEYSFSLFSLSYGLE